MAEELSMIGQDILHSVGTRQQLYCKINKMIENNFTAFEDMLKHFNSNEGSRRGGKIALAFCLSVLSFFLLFLLGEGFGAWALFVGMPAYFFIPQYLLSRGNALSARNDWPIIIALNSAPSLMTVLALAFESNKKATLPVLGVVILDPACSYAGAAFAKSFWQSSHSPYQCCSVTEIVSAMYCRNKRMEVYTKNFIY